MSAATVGASLVLSTVRTKLVVAVALLESVAVTVMVAGPTSLLVGVPLRVRVAASKVRYDGKPLIE